MSADLRKLLKDAIAEYPDAEVSEIATLVANTAPAKSLRSFLAETLVDEVRNLMGESRRDSMDGALGDRPPSPKMRDRASWWADMLLQRVHVNGKWISLSDCTFDDLQACIDEREQLISRVSGQIENYKRLQKLMTEHGSRRVADIPAQQEWKQAS